MGLGLGVAELTAGALGRTETPVVAVGEAFIDRTPGWLKDLAIEWFGTADKAVLVSAMLVVLAVFGALVGVLTVRRPGIGQLAAIVLLAVAGAAVWSRPDTSGVDLVVVAAGGVVAVPALTLLARRAVVLGARIPGSSSPGGATRRDFLTAASATTAVAVAGAGIGRMLGARRAGVETSRDDLAASVDFPSPDLPPGVDLGVENVEPWRTPNRDFYRVDTTLSEPLVRAQDWRLRIHGLVEEDIEIDYDGLVDMGLVHRWLTLNCVSNEVGGGLAGNALWTGVPIAEVLALARPLPDADAVLSTSDDGWSAGTPLDVLTDGRDALLAIGMNGEALPVEHGFPVRMIVPGLYGYVSATKWVVDLEVSRFSDVEAYWTTRGWSERGPVKVASRIDVPSEDADVPAGAVAVAGVAWAQHRGIAAVQIRVNDGPWQQTRLADVPSTDTWRQWVFEWDAGPGTHSLEVRAITADGEVQTAEEAPPLPNGASGRHRIEVRAG